MIFSPKFHEKLRMHATWGGLLKLPLLLPAFLLIVLIILLRPFIIVQIYKVYDWRFGHFVLSSHMVRLETVEWNNHHKKKKIIIYYFPSKIPSNNYLKQKPHLYWKGNKQLHLLILVWVPFNKDEVNAGYHTELEIFRIFKLLKTKDLCWLGTLSERIKIAKNFAYRQSLDGRYKNPS